MDIRLDRRIHNHLLRHAEGGLCDLLRGQEVTHKLVEEWLHLVLQGLLCSKYVIASLKVAYLIVLDQLVLLAGLEDRHVGRIALQLHRSNSR